MSKLATLSTILLLGSVLVLSLPTSLSRRESPCGAVHILVARGVNQPPGEGNLAPLVTQIKTRLAADTTVTSEAIRYTATMVPYPASAAEGTEAVKSQLTDAASRCPTSKIVLLGFSEGAHIIGDAFGGGGGGHFLGPKTPPMNASIIREHVKAVVLFADPRHNVAEPFNRGTATKGGLFPRDAEQVAALSEFKDLIVGYCDRNDIICASGKSTLVHLTAVVRHLDDATDFVAGKV
ncbi:hypothetical protein HK104_000026 [Borealophlyctis nickersoniae]|nr:hypothetical protein HK104_000026 [Borealophlyctis nickersoniae]